MLHFIRIFLMVFWLYVGLDKLWDLKAFHIALQRQPFPNWWADVLYWSLPVAELGIALLFLLPSVFPVIQRSKATSESGKNSASMLAFLLSALLLLSFTIYIGLGIVGFYAKRPCGCASIFSGLSWVSHFWINITLIILSVLGWHLSRRATPTDKNIRYKRSILLFQAFLSIIVLPVYHIVFITYKRFPRKFAPFPGRPVSI